jgi:hypothetical protein
VLRRCSIVRLAFPVLLLACGQSGGNTSGSLSESELAACKVVPQAPVQVSHEPVTLDSGKTAYMRELQIAINPANPNQLVASGIYTNYAPSKDPDHQPQEVYAYYSADRGKTWAKSELPPFPRKDGKRVFGGDPMVVFSKKGTAMYLTYTSHTIPNQVHLSSDGGKTWAAPIKATAQNMDHWMLVGDYTDGPHAGNVYAFGMDVDDKQAKGHKGPSDYNKLDYRMRLLVTSDDGKTWSDNVVTLASDIGLKGKGLNSVSDILVARNGKLYLPFHSWDNIEMVAGPRGQWITTSEDGGKTFAKAHELKTASGALLTSTMANGMPAYALDNTDGPFKDRLYVIWKDSLPNQKDWKLLFSYSDDDGATFAEPRIIVDSLLRSEVPQPDAAVNKNGVLVVTYYEFRVSGPDVKTRWGTTGKAAEVHRYVVASVDGGKSFTPITTLSATPIKSLAFFSKDYGWSAGVDLGDYFNMVTSPDGTFHTIWENGDAPQVYYSAVTVACGSKPAVAVKH